MKRLFKSLKYTFNTAILNLVFLMSVQIYTTKTCLYCVRAKALLEKKNINYQEIDISNDQNLRNDMIKKANGRTTIPQIFINDQHIGGCDDLYALDKKGELDKLLY